MRDIHFPPPLLAGRSLTPIRNRPERTDGVAPRERKGNRKNGLSAPLFPRQIRI